MTVLGSLRRRLHLDASVHGEYAVEMPVHLLRALYVRDHWDLPVAVPPRALGITLATPATDAGMAEDWAAWWAWLATLDSTDARLLDQPGQRAQGSKCPPAFAILLETNALEVGAWTTGWRTRFREEIVPAGTEVEQRLARDFSRGGTSRILSVGVLPLRDPWLSWVGPARLLVSQRLREDPKSYLKQAKAFPHNYG